MSQQYLAMIASFCLVGMMAVTTTRRDIEREDWQGAAAGAVALAISTAWCIAFLWDVFA